MIQEADLRELVEFDGQGSPVLSLYLDVDPRHRTTDKSRLALRRLFDSEPQVDPTDRKRIEQYLDVGFDRQARGIACFSCQKKDFWRVYTFEVPIDDAIMIGRRPLVRRLVDLFDTYGRMGVVAVDKLGARFFTFHLGVLEEATGTVGEDVKRHKQGGWSSSRYQRHEDEAAMSNLRTAAELTEEYARRDKWHHLVLAGTEANVAQFQELLPKAIQEMVVGSMPLSLSANIQDVRERAGTIALNARHDYNQNLASELIVAASKGANAVMGLASTLDALQAGRVYRLLITEGYQVDQDAVQRCTACNYLSIGHDGSCPVCASPTETLTNIMNTIARRAIVRDAHITSLAPDNPLAREGQHLGAFLRY